MTVPDRRNKGGKLAGFTVVRILTEFKLHPILFCISPAKETRRLYWNGTFSTVWAYPIRGGVYVLQLLR